MGKLMLFPVGILIFALVLVAAAAGSTMTNTMNIPINKTHIEARGHTRALELIPEYEAGICRGKWVGYNIVAGTVMVSCGVPNTQPAECLVISYRITEDGGTTVLVNEAYNTTAYVDYCYKTWSRRGFASWEDAGTWVVAPIDLKAAIITAFGEP